MIDTQTILHNLGIGKNYKGFRFAYYALMLVLQDEDKLENLKQDVLIPVAMTCGTSYSAVERGLRTVIQRAWFVNPGLLREMARFPLDRQPTVSEFLVIISTHVMRSKAASRPAVHEAGQLNFLPLSKD